MRTTRNHRPILNQNMYVYTPKVSSSCCLNLFSLFCPNLFSSSFRLQVLAHSMKIAQQLFFLGINTQYWQASIEKAGFELGDLLKLIVTSRNLIQARSFRIAPFAKPSLIQELVNDIERDFIMVISQLGLKFRKR